MIWIPEVRVKSSDLATKPWDLLCWLYNVFCLFWNRDSLYNSPGCLGTHQASLQFTEILLSLPLKCWNQKTNHAQEHPSSPFKDFIFSMDVSLWRYTRMSTGPLGGQDIKSPQATVGCKQYNAMPWTQVLWKNCYPNHWDTSSTGWHVCLYLFEVFCFHVCVYCVHVRTCGHQKKVLDPLQLYLKGNCESPGRC